MIEIATAQATIPTPNLDSLYEVARDAALVVGNRYYHETEDEQATTYLDAAIVVYAGEVRSQTECWDDEDEYQLTSEVEFLREMAEEHTAEVCTHCALDAEINASI